MNSLYISQLEVMASLFSKQAEDLLLPENITKDIPAPKSNQSSNASQTAILSPEFQGGDKLNRQFDEQRLRLEKFHKHFKGTFRAIINEIEGDIFTIKEKNIDKSVLAGLVKLRNRLELIYKNIEETQPYIEAWELVEYLEDRPVKMLMENLEFLINHHLGKTTVKGKLPLFSVEAQFNSLEKLKDFAHSLKAYMEGNPLIQVPMMPQRLRQDNPNADPTFLVDPDNETAV